MTQWKTFQYDLTIKIHHLDTFGHVNNAAYLEILEEARWDILDQGTFGLKDILVSKLGPVILEVQLKFLKELRANERVKIVSQVVAYNHKICTLVQDIVDSSGAKAATAEFKIGLFDLEKRKLVMPTESWLKTIGSP